MLKRPHYMALGLVGLLTLILLNLPHHTANQIKLAIGSLFLPLFGVAKSTQQLSGRGADALVPRSELLKQNEQFRQANQELQIRAMQADGLLRDNERFAQLFGWQKQSQWKVRLARVVARDPANWWHSIQIDVGTRDGMRPDLPVMTTAGLVGRISRVTLTSSEVALIGTPDCKVSAMVLKAGGKGENAETGVITGPGSQWDDTLVMLSFLSTSANLKPGQIVKTWGVNAVFPSNIIIGQVAEESHPAELGYNEVRVKLAVNLGALEDVWVMIQ